MIEASATETFQPRFQTLGDYELWVSENWVHELGSEDAQQHVRAKLREEVQELNLALENEPSTEIMSEVGDVLWTTVAVAMNEGFSLEDAFRRSSVAEHFTEGSITLEKVDKIALEANIDWDVPVLKALYNLSPEEVKRGIIIGDLKMTQMVMESLSGQLGKSARVTRVLTPMLSTGQEAEHTFGAAWAQLQNARVVEAVTQVILLASIIAQNSLGSSLSEIAQGNYDKLSKRLAQGHPVTKTSSLNR